LGFVERDVGNVFLRGSEIDAGLGRRMVAPGDGGVEIADEVRRKFCGEGFAVEFGGETGGEVLEHDEADEERVARRPGGGLVAEEAELEREVGALKVDGGVDAGGVLLEKMKLVGRQGSEGAVGGDAKLEGALEAIVDQEAGAKDLGESAGGVTTESVHLPETILRSDEALGEDEVVERRGAKVGDAARVALDSDGGREAGDGEGAVELGEGIAHSLAEPVTGHDRADNDDENDERGEDNDDAAEDAAACGFERGLFGSEGLVGDYVGVGETGKIHDLTAGI
jgi:hypothetical protein